MKESTESKLYRIEYKINIILAFVVSIWIMSMVLFSLLIK
jgi:hypothetical protein